MEVIASNVIYRVMPYHQVIVYRKNGLVVRFNLKFLPHDFTIQVLAKAFLNFGICPFSPSTSRPVHRPRCFHLVRRE